MYDDSIEMAVRRAVRDNLTNWGENLSKDAISEEINRLSNADMLIFLSVAISDAINSLSI